MIVANAITLGTLAAIRPHGQTPWTLGIVRRMRKMTADRAEIGLQVIANTLIGVDLVEQRKGSDAGYSVAGEGTINGRTFHGLFLSLKKREGDSVQSLIVPAAEYQPTKRLKLMTSKSINPIRFGRLLEQQPDWVWATVEQPLELTQPLPSANTVTGRRFPRRPRTSRLAGMPADHYAEVHAGFSWNVPAEFNIATACCGRWAPDRTRFALYWEDESGATSAHSFWDLQREANRLSNVLAALGVGRGDRVALILPQRRETAVAHIAVYQMGAVAVPLSFLFGPDALEYRLENSETKVALVDAQSADNLAPIRARLPGLAHALGIAGVRGADLLDYDAAVNAASPHFTAVTTLASDPALIVYTSGTTGPPKGALLAHAALLGNLPASCIHTTVSRSRATSSGRPPTGRGQAGSWTRCCRRFISDSRSSAIAAVSIPSARSG
jgi:hypothetical protein